MSLLLTDIGDLHPVGILLHHCYTAKLRLGNTM